jgi:hypothetical protein
MGNFRHHTHYAQRTGLFFPYRPRGTLICILSDTSPAPPTRWCCIDYELCPVIILCPQTLSESGMPNVTSLLTLQETRTRPHYVETYCVAYMQCQVHSIVTGLMLSNTAIYTFKTICSLHLVRRVNFITTHACTWVVRIYV